MSAAQPKVLVVEDEPAQREVLAYNLEAEGFHVDRAENGDEALLLVNEAAPDVIVLDWMLPGVSGIEVCRRLKAMPETQDIPTIVYCNRPVSSEELTRGYEAGADAYLSKAEMPVLDHIVRVKVREKARIDDLAEQNRALEERARRLIEEQQHPYTL